MSKLRVRTAGSTYLLDLVDGWATRMPGEEAAHLRRDGERLRLLGLAGPIELGEPMVLVLAGLGPAGITFRRTTPVLELAAVHEAEPRRQAGQP